MEKYLYIVRHPQHGEARVTAEDRLHAVVEAAHSWGIMKWSGIARACEVEKQGPAIARTAAAVRLPGLRETPGAIPEGDWSPSGAPPGLPAGTKENKQAKKPARKKKGAAHGD